ncbi:MAG: DMT family transporter [Candidatus Bathyarchaeia archaeon]
MSIEGRGTVAAVIVATIWGLSFVAARIILTTLSPVLLAALRFFIASVVFAPIILRESNQGGVLPHKDLGELAVLGFLSISVYFWLQYTGVKFAGAGISALLVVGLIPILTGLASSVLLRERLNSRKALGTALGLLGVTLITVPGLLIEKVDWRFYIGVACLFGNAACWALYSTMSRRLMKRIQRPALVTAWVTIFGTLALIPMSLSSDWSRLGSLTPLQWSGVAYLAIVCSGLGYFLWNYALSRLEAVKAAVWLYLEPIMAFIGEIIILGATPSVTTILGGVVVILGALITSRTRS